MDSKPGPPSASGDRDDVRLGVGSILKGLGGFIDLVCAMAINGENHVERKGGFTTRLGGKPLQGSYGFEMRLGIDANRGKDAPVSKEKVPVEGTPEVFEEPDRVRIIVDVPGADSAETRIVSGGTLVELSANGAGRSYRLRLPVPEVANPALCHVRCRNGIAEICFDKKKSFAAAEKGATP